MSPANYPADLADRLFAFETGELDEEETLQFFADLVASGWAWHLEGIYGRTAANEIPIAGGTSFQQRPTHSFPAAPGAHFPGSPHPIVAGRGSLQRREERNE
jgi:hypothetical protein